LSQMASGVGLYWGASSAIGILQAVLVNRRRAA
jgi:membrane protein insertase Oxa1/YidC/SpoIIIJ